MIAIERARLAVARAVPHTHQGRSMLGMDCVGLIVWAFDLEDAPADYGRHPHAGTLERHLAERFGPAVGGASEAQPGDVVSMRFVAHGRPRHVGIVAEHPQGGLSLIHSNSQAGRAVEHRLDAEWLARIVAAYRPGVMA
jgi:cell wall-associated NlpC family hydrolase